MASSPGLAAANFRACGVHARQAGLGIGPARQVVFQLGPSARPDGRFALGRAQAEDPIADAQLDVAVRMLFKKRTPMGVLIAT